MIRAQGTGVVEQRPCESSLQALEQMSILSTVQAPYVLLYNLHG
jgi:hypothetical protein